MTAPAAAPPGRPRQLLADLGVVLVPSLVARALVLLGWYVAGAVAASGEGPRPVAMDQGLLAWDGAYYRDIATIGYEHLPADSLRFFPLYPVLARAVALPFGGNADLGLVVFANLSALVLGVLVLRLARRELGPEGGRRAVWAVAAFPGAFVLSWAYAEALFLALGVASYLAARNRRWLIAAALAAGAGLTRPLGVLLALPLLVEAYDDWRAPDRLWSERASMAAAVAAPVAGTLAFVAWVEHAWGRWFLPYTVQSDLRGEAIDPLRRLARGVVDLFGAERFGDGLHVPFAIGFVVLAVVAWRRLPRSAAVYATAVLVVSLWAANLNSLERYALNAFPLALAVAAWAGTVRRERLVLAVGGAGLVGLSSLAWLGRYVP